MRLRPTLLLATLLAACSSAPRQFPQYVTYTCKDGTALRVRFAPDGAHVTLPNDTELILPQRIAASGIWYAAPRYDLRGKGNEATWTVDGRMPTICRVSAQG